MPIGQKSPHVKQSWKPVYNFDEIVFKRFLGKNRWFQNEALKAMDTCKTINGTRRGIVSLPTGTGKTRVQVAAHVHRMIELTKVGKTGNFVILSHRLALNKQLLSKLVDLAVKTGLKFNILFVGAAKAPNFQAKYQGLGVQIEGDDTTLTKDVNTFVTDSHANGKHVLIVSTYDSFSCLEELAEIDIITADEAHMLESTSDKEDKEFKEDYERVRSKVNVNAQFFFTATRRARQGGGGMDNSVFYGEVLYIKTPAEMIDEMEILPPYAHEIRVNTKGMTQEEFDALDEGGKETTSKRMAVEAIMQGYLWHGKFLAKVSADPSKIAPKLLVSMEYNSTHITYLRENIEFQNFCANNDIHFLSFSSSPSEGYHYNFKQCSRDFLMEKLVALKDTDKAILTHIDILTEGIDLPSITAILPFRLLEQTKLVQTLGRGARLLDIDRDAYYRGIIQNCSADILAGQFPTKLVKPCFCVLLPVFYEAFGSARDFKNKAAWIYEEFNGKMVIEKSGAIPGIEDPNADRVTEQEPVEDEDVHSLKHCMKSILGEEEFEQFRKTIPSLIDEQSRGWHEVWDQFFKINA